jgi:L-alanine-DL-glutamate epimerase-like enolase superfamily enzyme
MKKALKQIIENSKNEKKALREDTKSRGGETDNKNDRRDFLKKLAFGGISMAGFMGLPVEDAIAHSTSKVQRNSSPSDLKITDMRVAVVGERGQRPIIRIDTNQDIYGYGEVRDGADPRYALMLKGRILGMNPTNVEQIWRTIYQFGGHGRQAGGVCAVEMAMWDLCGKAWDIPAWQLLGGARYRDKVRMYADTPSIRNEEEFKERIDLRLKQGFTWIKMDLMLDMIKDVPGAIVNKEYWQRFPGGLQQYNLSDPMNYGSTKHPFTQVQITEKGIDLLAEYVEKARDIIGMEMPLCADHFGHFDLNNGIRLGQALEKYRLAFLEDLVPWFYPKQWKSITEALNTPTCTGEDIFSLNKGFKELIDMRAVDIIHPDIASSGGLLETKKIGDYAEDNGVAMVMHMAGLPITYMASVHCAAATKNFLALEHHSVDNPWYNDLVEMTGEQPLFEDGFAPVPVDSPGLGVELNEDEVKKHLHPEFEEKYGYFKPTPEWDEFHSHDRIWS